MDIQRRKITSAARAPDKFVTRASSSVPTQQNKPTHASLTSASSPRGAGASFASTLEGLFQQEASIDKATKQSFSKKTLSQDQLIGLQIQFYRYAEQLDLASKALEKTSHALRQVVQQST